MELYEYSDKENFRTTGKSIQFHIPKFYTTDALSQEGGTLAQMTLQFDLAGDVPYVPSSYTSKEEYRQHDANTLALMLMVYADYNPLTLSAISMGAGASFGVGGLNAGRFVHQDASFCGQEIFLPDVATFDGRKMNDEADRAPKNAAWPYSTGVVFATRQADGRFSEITSCSAHASWDGYPHCSTLADFRGWPTSVGFSGRYACSRSMVVDRMRQFLSKYVAKETQRGPEEHENRNTSRSEEISQ